MARRNQRKNDYLVTSDYSNTTIYASEAVIDFWGDVGKASEVLKRNLQEIATPLNDPYPVKLYRGPSYEKTNACDFETQPLYVGKTTKPFPNNQVTSLFGLNLAIPDMAVGCTFVVR